MRQGQTKGRVVISFLFPVSKQVGVLHPVNHYGYIRAIQRRGWGVELKQRGRGGGE